MEEKILKHKNAFEKDPILASILEHGLEDLIFDDEEYFDSISFSEGYSTKRASQLIGVPDKSYKITNLLSRDILKDYFGVYKKDNAFYRYTWDSIFKLKMVITLMEHKNLGPADIIDIINIPTLIREESSSEPIYNRGASKGNDIALNKEFDSQELFNAAQQFTLMLSRKNTLETELSSYKNELRNLEIELSNLEENKGYLDLLILKDKSDEVSRAKNKGFFSFLFGSSNESVESTGDSDVVTTAKERIENLEENKSRISTQQAEIESKIKATEAQLETLGSLITRNHSKELERATRLLEIEEENLKEEVK